MKYAIAWNNKFEYLKDVDEIILSRYEGTSKLLSFVPSIIKDKECQRIIVNLAQISDEITFDNVITYINKLQEDGYNIGVQTISPAQINSLKENNIPFIIDSYCGSLEEVYIQASLGASDIYITNELGFRVKDLQYLKDKFKFKIRVIPNVAQVSYNGESIIPSIKQFWIRPEDTELYEPYIDVFEIYGPEKLSILYKIYSERCWAGNLNEIIIGFEDYVTNRSMPPYLGQQRLNCGQKCYMGKCDLCSRLASFANLLEDNNIAILKDKYISPKEQKAIEEMLNENRTDKENM